MNWRRMTLGDGTAKPSTQDSKSSFNDGFSQFVLQ
jgi:hypothetical protein